jgi:hypothetical protein
MKQELEFIADEIYGERLLISTRYVVHNSKAVVVSSANFSSPDKAAIKQIISEIIEKLRT